MAHPSLPAMEGSTGKASFTLLFNHRFLKMKVIPVATRLRQDFDRAQGRPLKRKINLYFVYPIARYLSLTLRHKGKFLSYGGFHRQGDLGVIKTMAE